MDMSSAVTSVSPPANSSTARNLDAVPGPIPLSGSFYNSTTSTTCVQNIKLRLFLRRYVCWSIGTAVSRALGNTMR
jgi:hypothetical protein